MQFVTIYIYVTMSIIRDKIKPPLNFDHKTTVVLLKTKQNVNFSPYLFQPLMEQSVFNRFWLGFVHA